MSLMAKFGRGFRNKAVPIQLLNDETPIDLTSVGGAVTAYTQIADAPNNAGQALDAAEEWRGQVILPSYQQSDNIDEFIQIIGVEATIQRDCLALGFVAVYDDTDPVSGFMYSELVVNSSDTIGSSKRNADGTTQSDMFVHRFSAGEKLGGYMVNSDEAENVLYFGASIWLIG